MRPPDFNGLCTGRSTIPWISRSADVRQSVDDVQNPGVASLDAEAGFAGVEAGIDRTFRSAFLSALVCHP